MGMLDICSNNSYWRGLDYFERKKVKSIIQLNEYEYESLVEGTENYHVHMNINHPRKSTCTCPHASGKSIICKHKVAVYFSIFPKEVKIAIEKRNRYYEELEEREKEYDKKVKEITKRITKYVNSLSVKEVRRLLINYMAEDEMEYIENPYEEESW